MTPEEIRRRFEYSTEFNEIFDAFTEALRKQLDDIELYRLLFWNPSLSTDESCMFGEKLAADIPSLAYETYMWLARIFEVTHSMADNYELSFAYYQKAAGARPESPDPYINAADCYEADLNIPPIAQLIEFLRRGAQTVRHPVEIYRRLTSFYELIGNDEMLHYYKMKEDSPPERGPAGPSPDEDDGAHEPGPGKGSRPVKPPPAGRSGKRKGPRGKSGSTGAGGAGGPGGPGKKPSGRRRTR